MQVRFFLPSFPSAALSSADLPSFPSIQSISILSFWKETTEKGSWRRVGYGESSRSLIRTRFVDSRLTDASSGLR